jgi:uncharacterized membrane protein
MIALSALVWLPRPALIAVGVVIVLGHNLLDPVSFAQSEPGHAVWAVLHDRGFIELPWDQRIRTSYPLLPWIGVAALGYAIGPWFSSGGEAAPRRRRLIGLGLGMLGLFGVLRGINVYGEPLPWSVYPDPLQTLMSVLNLTKYPPSADFLLLTLGLGTLLLAAFEGLWPRLIRLLSVYGGAPLFFYLIHLYGLHLAYRACLIASGANQGDSFGVPNVAWVWAIAVVAAIPGWFACRWFAGVKRRSSQWWMKYL